MNLNGYLSMCLRYIIIKYSKIGNGFSVDRSKNHDMNQFKISRLLLGIIVLACLGGSKVDAQVPAISRVDPISGTALSSISITGKDFGTNMSDVLVLFDGVQANIVGLNDNFIEVEVPPAARYESITVVRPSSSGIAYAPLPFLLSFSGSTFDASQIDAPSIIPEDPGLQDFCTCDFNGDGLADIATAHDNSPQINIWYNISSDFSTFNSVTINSGIPSALITCADLNGDGRAEIIVNEEGANTDNIGILRNTSSVPSVSFQQPAVLFETTENAPKKIAVQDLDLDGRPDLVVPNASGSVIDILVNNTTTPNNISFSSPQTVNTGSSFDNFDVEIGDLNGDRYPDIAVASNLDRDIFLLQNNGAGAGIGFDRINPITLPSNSTNLSLADFDNDGKLDLVVNQLDGNGIIFLRNATPDGGDIAMTGAAQLNVSDRPWDVAVGDINGDGSVDVVCTSNAAANSISVLINDGAFSFSRFDIPVGERTLYVDVRDMSGEGKPDIILTGITNDNLLLLKNRNCVEAAELTVEPSTDICAGQMARLEATKGIGISYSWDRDNVDQGVVTDFLETNVGGSFTVTLTSESGACVSESDPLVINSFADTAPALPDINGGDTPVCPGDVLALTTSTVTGAIYEWTGPNGFTSNQQSPTIPNFRTANAGLYTLQLTDGNCSSEVNTKFIDINDVSNLVIQTPGRTEVCEGSPGIALSTTSAFDSYQWRRDGANISGAISANFTADVTGNYSVVVTTSGCSRESDQVSVSIIPLPSASFSVDDEICAGSPVGFVNNSIFTGSPTFEWSFGDGTFSSDINPLHTYDLSGIYNVRLRVVFDDGCEDDFSQNVEVTDGITTEIISSIDTSFCGGESTILSVSGSWQSYQWSPGNENSAQIEVSATGEYSVVLTNSSGCTGSGVIDIVVLPSPIIEVTAESTFIEAGESVQLNASGAETYTWSPIETLDDPNISNPVATPLVATTYEVTGADSNSCSSTAEISIDVDNTIRIDPSNFISPNGDSRNDVWEVEGIEEYPQCAVKIFTDVGSVIYESKPYLNDWAGTINGDELPNGVYYYTIVCDGVKGNVRAGSITLLK